MCGWIWLSGYIVTLVMLFVMSVIVSHGKMADGEDAKKVTDDFSEYVGASVVYSLLSWVGLVFAIGMMIVLSGRKTE